jgi:hypothetical protein
LWIVAAGFLFVIWWIFTKTIPQMADGQREVIAFATRQLESYETKFEAAMQANNETIIMLTEKYEKALAEQREAHTKERLIWVEQLKRQCPYSAKQGD